MIDLLLAALVFLAGVNFGGIVFSSSERGRRTSLIGFAAAVIGALYYAS